MNSLAKQKGAFDLQLLFLVLMGGLLAVCTVKLAPVYIDHWTISEAFQGVKEEIDPETATRKKISSMLERRFTVNRIDQINTKDIEFVREKGRLLVSAPYEVRVPLLFNLDAVVKFPDTGFELNFSSDG